MKKSELLARIEALEAKVSGVSAGAGDAGTPAQGPCNKRMPKENDTYFWLTGIGDVDRYRWAGDEIDGRLWARGNCYRTEDACRRAEKRQLLIQELRDFAGRDGWRPDWDENSGYKYFLAYNHAADAWEYGTTLQHQCTSEIHFPSAARAAEVIAHFGDRLDLLLEGAE